VAGIQIDILANERDFLRGAGATEGALDDVAGSLDDLAKDAQKTTKGVGDDFDKLAKDAKKAGDKLGHQLGNEVKAGGKEASSALEKVEKSFKELADASKRESKEAGDKLGDGMKRGAREADSAVTSFKDEARQNFSEVASSFDGSIEGAVDGIQGTLGGLATSISGPLGLAFAGLGVVGGAVFTSIQEDAEETKEFVASAFEDMTESGKAYASEEFVNSQLKDIINDTGKMNEVQKDANSLGVDRSIVLRAQAGDQEALNLVIAAANDKYAAIRDRQREISETGAPIPGELQGQATAAEGLANKYGGLASNLESAAGKAAVYRDAQVGAAGSTDIAKAAVDRFNAAVAAIQSSKTVNVDADTSAAEAKLAQLARDRTVTINVNGDITRIGNQVW
jgi:gas vesicle protein